ncbi:L-threonylcarbamoyladenylate synthase [Nisaea acidiphila]|uniref:Threonylcarbamoyl-AMP synthase n=1 Tax=Nisaea acidiphila TaxID=1862145 RepID=A0A9J7ATC5_9PROT|nr:L-threonylcarbamoyladenylate synthase [Nisaea acidiphila]UUX49580.1 L-threonylcarbamoyladenylate synthase [Nisaea acidiphila]
MTETRTLPPSDDAIREAADALVAGELVAFPTETVYGLGGDATDDRAVAKIFEAKQRPSFNPLISHLPDPESAFELGDFDERSRNIAKAFWPGPMTLVVPRRAGCPISLLASAGLDTIALRVPAHPLAAKLLRAAGRPVAAPSANPSGRVSPTTAEHVLAGLEGQVSIILNGGPCSVGLESTVLDLSGGTPTILRPGAVTAEMLAPLAGPVAMAGHGAKIAAPGMLESHYAPALPVRLEATAPETGEIFLGFGEVTGPEGSETLSKSGDLTEAASLLFALLRALDRPGAKGIAVAPIPEKGLGIAINDRLRRAAAPRA